MQYLKDHLVIIFQSKTNSSQNVEFISANNYDTRNATGQTAGLEKFQIFNVINVVNGDKQLHYYIVIPYNIGQQGRIIPWNEAHVMYKIGETTNTRYPPPVGKPREISELKIDDTSPAEIAKISKIEENIEVSVIFGAIASVLAFIAVAIFIVYWTKCKNHSSDSSTVTAIPLLTKSSKQPVATPHDKFNEFLAIFDDEETVSDMKYLYIPPSDIEISTTMLGRGAFGIALVGRYRQKDVCVKTVRVDSPNGIDARYSVISTGYAPAADSIDSLVKRDLVKDIFNEALQMKSFEHTNVMKIIGVSFDGQLSPQIILPLMNRKDLHSYVGSEENEITYKMVSILFHDAVVAYLRLYDIIYHLYQLDNCICLVLPLSKPIFQK